jgi:hypothetical protein
MVVEANWKLKKKKGSSKNQDQLKAFIRSRKISLTRARFWTIIFIAGPSSVNGPLKDRSREINLYK